MLMVFNFILKLKIQLLMNGVVFLNIKQALEDQLGEGALDKFDQAAKDNMTKMNNYSKILYSGFKRIVKSKNA